MSEPTQVGPDDRRYLDRCVALAREAVEAGHKPFGSVLVSGEGVILKEDHNRTGDGDPTAHPELALARWAALNLTQDERARATLYTSGEHCPMCAAAHGWCGLGRIVFATSTRQLVAWLKEFGASPLPYHPFTLREMLPAASVAGPDPDYADEIRALHARAHGAGA
ncbi:nucleoside deaminase [Fulvimarina sp. 2208YS6-2-32]|uniref:Nucleoside deaminase n=1 Tax=Fulvimarina uroteuthidis TaxID=3098149 RepID=A0ABU5I7B1_9HYPH|nr:nucleoside deaminase [Fulvimarina sp. 2208YS6-2-32]MDY8111012.1 nucleoside deaminase [Fulvimarina sp. 2208YS6-2-32]